MFIDLNAGITQAENLMKNLSPSNSPEEMIDESTSNNEQKQIGKRLSEHICYAKKRNRLKSKYCEKIRKDGAKKPKYALKFVKQEKKELSENYLIDDQPKENELQNREMNCEVQNLDYYSNKKRNRESIGIQEDEPIGSNDLLTTLQIHHYISRLIQSSKASHIQF